ncbi:MAG TPA: hypothetical protein VGY56_10555 [Verrucomicrobiae bacterium]|nr:hypothetical protein [Verrucomicrobiae bacterium]
MNEKQNPQNQTAPAKPVKMQVARPLKVPTLRSGNDAEAAEQLSHLFDGAHNGMRKIIALGVFAWELKVGQLKHGQFGAWLAAHCPNLSEIHSTTQKPVSSRALRGYMDLTKNVLESAGYATIGKFLGSAARLANDANLGHGQFLLTEAKNVPEKLMPIRDKIFEIVDGKTQKQLFVEFKQANEDDDGSGDRHKKRGRLKGSTGLTKEMREKAAQRQEEARIAELEETTKETAKFLLENADAKNFGAIDPKILAKLCEAMETAQGFAKRLETSRK